MPDASGPELPPRQPEYGACFFLSYAHTPRVFDDGRDPNYWVHQFYRDLCTELVNLDSEWHRLGPPGFIDGDMGYGTDWRRQLAAQLARCRVFIPLYSRSYFTRENCGREWSVFRDRQMAHMAQTGTPNEAILPVLWQPPRPEDLPAVASALQIAPLGRAGRYLERGLYELIRLDRDGEYVEAVINLAEHLDRKARAAPPPGPEVEFDDVRPAFPSAGVTPDVQRLYITVSASDRNSLPNGRDPAYYGDSPEQWNPYHPDLDEPLLARAEQVARGLGYEPVRSVLNRSSPELRPTARPLGRPETSPDGPGILLVDPWTAHETAGTRHIAQFDHTRKPWIRVMVPWFTMPPPLVWLAVLLLTCVLFRTVTPPFAMPPAAIGGPLIDPGWGTGAVAVLPFTWLLFRVRWLGPGGTTPPAPFPLEIPPPFKELLPFT